MSCWLPKVIVLTIKTLRIKLNYIKFGILKWKNVNKIVRKICCAHRLLCVSVITEAVINYIFGGYDVMDVPLASRGTGSNRY